MDGVIKRLQLRSCTTQNHQRLFDFSPFEGNVTSMVARQLLLFVGTVVFFIHNDFSLVDEPGSIKREIHGTRWGSEDAAVRPPPSREPVKPNYSPSIQPLEHEPDFPKREWSGFHETHVDYHLRCHGIKTLIAVGFSQRACLYLTCTGAVEHNYRVIMLRDCTHSGEYPDTVDESLEEGGWLRKIMFRNFEHVVGYTSTSAELVGALSG